MVSPGRHADPRHVTEVEHFLLVVADDDQRVQPGGGDVIAQPGDRRLRIGMALPQRLRFDPRGGIRWSMLQQIGIPARPALEIDVLARPVAPEERALHPVFGLCRQHRAVRGAISSNQPCHRSLRGEVGRAVAGAARTSSSANG